MEDVRIAIVGCGMIAQALHLPNISRHPALTLRWCCDIDPATLSEVAARFAPEHVAVDPAEVAADPHCDAVLIATTHRERIALIELFARAGKHVFVEKPLADSFEEMKKILAVFRETGVLSTVGHNRRMAPAVLEAQRILAQHRGKPVSPDWRWDREGEERPFLAGGEATMVLLRINDDHWSWKKWAFAHGPLINEMTHFADLACAFIPAPPCRVQVTGNRAGNHVVNIEFADGSIACIFATAHGSFGYPKELVEIYHNGGAVIVDHLMEVRTAGVVGQPLRKLFGVVDDRYPQIAEQGIEGYYRRIEAARQDALSSNDNSILPPQPDKGHYALLDDFVQCIRTGRQPVCSAEVAAVPTAIILRALQSESEGGRPIAIGAADLKA